MHFGISAIISYLCIHCLWFIYIILFAMSEAKAIHIFTSSNNLYYFKNYVDQQFDLFFLYLVVTSILSFSFLLHGFSPNMHHFF
jgi:hypothetical protein